MATPPPRSRSRSPRGDRKPLIYSNIAYGAQTGYENRGQNAQSAAIHESKRLLRDARQHDNPITQKFDPLSFERESRGLMIACSPLLPATDEMKVRIAFSLHPQCLKYLVLNNFGFLKGLHQESNVMFHVHQEPSKPKVLELWADNRKAVSYSSYKVRDFLIKKAKDEAAELKQARLEQQKRNFKGPRYQVSISIVAPTFACGPVIGNRGDVQRALATRAGIDKLDIHKEGEDGTREIIMSGMPYAAAYAKCLVQERLRYKGIERVMTTGHPNLTTDDLDEELLFSAYKAVWTEYFSQKGICDYATVLTSYVSAAAATTMKST